jgi:hypothetical protein
MFGLGKKSAPRGKDLLTPREKATAEVRAQLEVAASVLTWALHQVDIDSGQLAAERAVGPGGLAPGMVAATEYAIGGERLELRLGKTVDHQTFDLDPHYRYREICCLIEDFERALSDAQRVRQLATRHAPHALLQARLLSHFLLRMPVVEDLMRNEDMAEIERELLLAGKAIASLSAQLTAPLLRHIDLQAVRAEWVGWPQVFSVPAGDRAAEARSALRAAL